MIPFDFAYYKPATVEEAVRLHGALRQQGKSPVYYAGGTEIITLGRVNEVYTEAVIDIKGIAECRALRLERNRLVMGAAVTLNAIRESNHFRLLGDTVSEIADHTSRNRITLGGNLCGRIHYREAVLPLLLADAEMVVAGSKGERRQPLASIFEGRPKLKDGELIVRLEATSEHLSLPYYTVKKRRQWDVGYPLLTVAALKKNGRIRCAFSGVCPFPFRDERLEDILNDSALPMEERIERAIRHLPGPVSDDVEGSPEYRLFVLGNTLLDAWQALGGNTHEQH